MQYIPKQGNQKRKRNTSTDTDYFFFNRRTLFSVCTGSLFLAQQGILSGLSATTHPDAVIRFENLCSQAAQRDLTERADVVEGERYIVNNLRFELGDDEDENPYVRTERPDGRRPSNARLVANLDTELLPAKSYLWRSLLTTSYFSQ